MAHCSWMPALLLESESLSLGKIFRIIKSTSQSSLSLGHQNLLDFAEWTRPQNQRITEQVRLEGPQWSPCPLSQLKQGHPKAPGIGLWGSLHTLVNLFQCLLTPHSSCSGGASSVSVSAHWLFSYCWHQEKPAPSSWHPSLGICAHLWGALSVASSGDWTTPSAFHHKRSCPDPWPNQSFYWSCSKSSMSLEISKSLPGRCSVLPDHRQQAEKKRKVKKMCEDF